MLNEKGDFSDEYVSADVTEFPQPKESDEPDKKEETEFLGPKYGLSKPQRNKIRGKIIHD